MIHLDLNACTALSPTDCRVGGSLTTRSNPAPNLVEEDPDETDDDAIECVDLVADERVELDPDEKTEPTS